VNKNKPITGKFTKKKRGAPTPHEAKKKKLHRMKTATLAHTRRSGARHWKTSKERRKEVKSTSRKAKGKEERKKDPYHSIYTYYKHPEAKKPWLLDKHPIKEKMNSFQIYPTPAA